MTGPPVEGAETVRLELVGVTRQHAGRHVWQAVDLRLESGTLTVLTGANGAGKTTLLRIAAGLLRPTTGTRSCSGRAVYVRGGAGLRSALTVAEAVASTAGLAGRRGQAPAALELLGVSHLAERRVGGLSAGERVRVALAAAWAAEPSLLCLDEPTAALDESGAIALAGFLAEVRRSGSASFVATHQPERLLGGADAHLSIGAGRLVRQGAGEGQDSAAGSA